MVNEAALLAARKNRTRSRWPTSRRRSTGWSPVPERKQPADRGEGEGHVAYHEVGHAIVMELLPHHDPVAQGDDPAAGHGARA